MRRFLYDTNIFVYAVGAAHPYREPCRRIVELARQRRLHGEASTEMVQEFTHVRARRASRSQAAHDARSVVGLLRLHPLGERELDLALNLFERQIELSMRDAIHWATATLHGIDAILSVDRGFDAAEGLQRIDPADMAAVDALAS
jgi:predicted nucleic acid-binding protein